MVGGMNRISAALDLIAEAPDVPDVSGMVEQLRAVVDRLDVQSPLLTGRADGARPIDGRVLLVGWNHESLERRFGEVAPVATAAPRPVAVPPIVDAELARLQRRPSRAARTAPVATAPRPAIAPSQAPGLAIVSLASDGRDLGDAEIEVLRLLRSVVEERLRQSSRKPPTRAERPLLSRRENECLQWTSAGKTTWEISAILKISQNTIDGYIAAATRKLGAVNRTQAVAEALRRGLID